MRLPSRIMRPACVLLGLGLAFSVAGRIAGPLGAARAATETFQTSAPFAFLEDVDSRTVLLDKNADAPMEPASTTKIMTAEIVFHEITEGRLKLDDKFVVSDNAWRRGGARSGGSSMFLAVNSEVRVEDLIRGLLIDSGNDAAITLAEGIAGSEDNFAAIMNKRAAELGLTHCHFTNPWGKGDPDHHVTARDMAALAIHVIQTYPEFYHYFGERDFTWNKVHQLNRNPLLTMNIGADGLKTGDIEASGFGLVGSAVQNGERLILVLNGLKTARERATEALKLLSWGFRAFEPKDVFATGEVVGAARVYGGTADTVPLAAERPVKLLIPRGSGDKLTGKIVYKGPLPAPVSQGAEVAELHLYRNATEVLSMPLITTTSVGLGSLPHRAMDAGLELVTAFIRQNFTKP